MRSSVKTLWCLLIAATLWLGVASQPMAKTYALVIGIDRYQHITPLRGAVNDAVDIAAAISTLKPEKLDLLLNEKATRAAILGAWEDFVDNAEPGDTIIVTYAGHGSSVPALDPSLEEDGRDETLLLAGFEPTGPGAGERIRDDEIAALIARRPDVEHILVADSCHSGTAIRSTQFDLGYRFYNLDDSTADPLPPPPPPPEGMRTDTDPGLGNSVFFAAVGDDELAPEVNIDGNVRGALSYAFARGIRGAADKDQDGLLTKGELETYIRRQVKSLLDGRQKPRVSPLGQTVKPLFSLNTTLKREGSAFSRTFEALPTVPVVIMGKPDDVTITYEMLSGVHPVPEPQQGGIIIDFDRAEIRSASGDKLRRLTREVGYDWRRQVQAIVDKMRIVNRLSKTGVDSTIEVAFPLGDTLYFEDDDLTVLVTGRTTRHVTLLNISAEGRLQWLYPRYPPIDRKSGFNDPPELAPNEPLSFDTYAVPPFGAEHIIAIETARPMEAVRRAAKRFDGSDRLELFWREMHIALGGVPHAVGIHAYVTAEQ